MPYVMLLKWGCLGKMGERRSVCLHELPNMTQEINHVVGQCFDIFLVFFIYSLCSEVLSSAANVHFHSKLLSLYIQAIKT